MSSSAEQKRKLSEAFTAEYGNLLSYVKARFRGDGKADAEDIVQDVILNIYKRVDFNTPIENLLGYLYRSLKNRIIDIGRKKKEELFTEYDDEENGDNLLLRRMDSMEEDEEDPALYEERREQMFEMLDKLRPDHREIIIRTELEGYTFEELSKEWNVPIGTLLSRKHRAMAKLQKLLLR